MKRNQDRIGVLVERGEGQTQSTPHKPLWLTRDEACHLLEMCVASVIDLGAREEVALAKLGDMCRSFFRDDAAPETPPVMA